jgi:ribA/ribD-fused uncharacterized protein
MVNNLEALRKEYMKGTRYNFLLFWGHTPPPDGGTGPHCLSQWWMQRFTVGDITYSCAEQYMLTEKARLFGDDERLAKIMGAKLPKDMKAFGREVLDFDNAVWDRNCYRIV